MIREISVKIENEPGRLHAVVDRLGEAGVNVVALSMVDRETSGELRLIVSDLTAARRLLMAMDVPASVNTVLAVTVPDRPGGLAAVLEPLRRRPLDIRYLYAFRRPGTATGTAAVVLHTEDNPMAAEVLTAAGWQLLDEDSLYG